MPDHLGMLGLSVSPWSYLATPNKIVNGVFHAFKVYRPTESREANTELLIRLACKFYI